MARAEYSERLATTTGCSLGAVTTDGGARVVPEVSETFLHDRLTDAWDGGQPGQSDLEVSEVISRFRPQQVAPDAWLRVEAFVRDAVTAAGPRTPFIADHEMTVVAQLVLWADRLGIPLDPAVVLSPETIERFFHEGVPHLTNGSRINYRTHLWRVGRAMLSPELFPPKPLPGQRSEVSAPYAEGEITELWSWARGLPTAHMRRNARALLAIGFGAGLTSEEIQRLVGTDIHIFDGIVVVDVMGKRARHVPVLASWAPEVLGFAEESGSRPYFAPERTRITRRDVIGFIERCSLDDSARFCIQRLRISWIVQQLSAGTHMLLLEAASGVGAGQLVKYLKYAASPPPGVGRAALAGGLHVVASNGGAGS